MTGKSDNCEQVDRYEVRLNGEGSWQSLSAAPALELLQEYLRRSTGGVVGFVWPLKDARNVLEVRPVNSADVPGIISRLGVELP